MPYVQPGSGGCQRLLLIAGHKSPVLTHWPMDIAVGTRFAVLGNLICLVSCGATRASRQSCSPGLGYKLLEYMGALGIAVPERHQSKEGCQQHLES